jgi:hypothetical protein
MVKRLTSQLIHAAAAIAVPATVVVIVHAIAIRTNAANKLVQKKRPEFQASFYLKSLG